MKLLLDGVRQKTTTTGPKDLLSDWENADPADPQISKRHQLFAQVETLAEETLREHHKELRKLRSRPIYDPELPDHRLNPLVWHKSLLRVLVRPHMENFAELLHLRGYSRFIVAFDDCTTLNTGFGINMSWVALQRIINAADRLALPVKFWFLLLDKTSSLYDLAPREKITSSFRLRDKFRMLHPWMYLGFNQHLSDVCLTTPQQALLLRHMKMYGRPVSANRSHCDYSVEWCSPYAVLVGFRYWQ